MVSHDEVESKSATSDRETRVLLQVVFVVATAVTAIATAAALYFLFSAVIGSAYLGEAPSVSADLDPAQTTLAQLADADIGDVTEVVAIVDGATDGAGYRVWALVSALGALSVAAGAWMIRGIVASVRAGDPFVSINVRRLRMLGFLLATVPFVLSVGSGIAADLLLDAGLGISAEVDFSWIFAGFSILIVAEVWSRGIEMRNELELTI